MNAISIRIEFKIQLVLGHVKNIIQTYFYFSSPNCDNSVSLIMKPFQQLPKIIKIFYLYHMILFKICLILIGCCKLLFLPDC